MNAASEMRFKFIPSHFSPRPGGCKEQKVEGMQFTIVQNRADVSGMYCLAAKL